MDNGEIIKRFIGILTGVDSEQDTAQFTEELVQIAREGLAYRTPAPIDEALETLDVFLEELDEFYGLAVLKYGSEAYGAVEVLRSWYAEQKQTIEPTERNGRWMYWSGWRGNHDLRIDDATCSECGYEHHTVRYEEGDARGEDAYKAVLDKLSDKCPKCGAVMQKA